MRFLAVAALALAGCAHEIPADQASNWQVCEQTMRSDVYGRRADAERARRGLDCAPYYQAILAQRQQQGRAMQDAAALFRPASPQPVTGGGFLKRSYTSGFNRICIYDRLGNEYATTIAATAICPLSP